MVYNGIIKETIGISVIAEIFFLAEMQLQIVHGFVVVKE